MGNLMYRNLIFGLLITAPALQLAAGQHPAVGAHANAVAGLANAARIEACANLSRALLDALDKGDFKAATSNFDSHLRTALDSHALGTAWNAVGRQLGKFESHGAAKNMMYKNMPVIATPLHFEKGDLQAQVVCDQGGKIAGFRVHPAAQAPSG